MMMCQYPQKISILCRYLPQYRQKFYELLKIKLEEKGVELCLVYGDGQPSDRIRKDLVHLPWARFRPNRIFRLLGHDFYWQPALKDIQDSDLIIVEQASKLLINYYLQLLQLLGFKKMAFWGHGRNFQAKAKNRTAEKIKKMVSKHASWWFAYNNLSKDIVSELGFPPERVTVVQNSIDTKYLRESRENLKEQDNSRTIEDLGLIGKNVCIFCGGMYEEKCLDFLFKSACLIREEVKDFELLFVGSGIDREKVETFAKEKSWAHYLGPLFFEDKVKVFGVSRLLLMPGLVGLGILDSFSLGVPLVTTDFPMHSPEIDYLENHVNGVMTFHSLEAYSELVISLLKDSAKYETLRDGALLASHHYTLEAMVKNFSEGVFSALAESK